MQTADDHWPASVASMWSQWVPPQRDPGSQAVAEITRGLVELTQLLDRDDSRFDQRCRNFVRGALDAQRLAWSSAGRAVWAIGLWRHGDEDSALLQMVLAELDLQREARHARPDPVGGPVGAAVAASQLGLAYHGMRMFELAMPHLHRAARLSEDLYGPPLRLQVLMDYANLAEIGVQWALHAEAVGRLNEARQRARTARNHARGFGVAARQQQNVQATRYAQALMIGARSVVAPEEIDDRDRLALIDVTDHTVFGESAAALVVWAIQARVCRLTGDEQGCMQAAQHAVQLPHRGDLSTVSVALREAALMEAPTPFTWSFARAIAGQTEAARRRSVAAFRTRLALAGLEQRTQRPNAEREKLQQQLEDAARDEVELVHAATHDQLTGLPNGTLFVQRLDGALQDIQEEGHVAVAVIDVDDLQQVNDTRGQETGDSLLRWVSDRLQASVRPADMVARLGGDGFAVLLTGRSGVQTVRDWAERLNDDVNDLRAQTHAPHAVTVSVGVCVVPPGAGATCEELLSVAERQMIQAKQAGKARARIAVLEPDST